MNYVAIRMLIGDRLKYLGLVAGVAFAALLITQQASIFTGFAMRTEAWLRDQAISAPQVDLWVMDPEVEMDNDFKTMGDTALSRVRSVAGVGWAVPMAKTYLQARLPDGRLKQCRLIGIDDASLIGGPPVIVEGTLADLRRDRAVLVERRQTLPGSELDVRVGERFSLNDHEVHVVGTFESTPEFFWEPLAYTTYSRLLSIAPPERKRTAYLLVNVRDGETVAGVARRIEAETGLKAMTGREFARTTRDFVLDQTGILINFGITIALGLVIGLLVAGQTFYGFVLDNLRHFGALKAMGTSDGTLLKMLLTQVIVVGSIGYGVGLAGASVTGYLFQKVGLAFQMTPMIPLIGAIGVILCCGVAGLLGIRRVIRLEPAIVFKG